MSRHIVRKSQRIKTFATLKYRGYKIAGEGIIKNVSLHGSHNIGNVPVTVGMVLALQIFVPGASDLLVIDRATVKWVKRAEFGVHFDGPKPAMAERIVEVVAMLAKAQHSSSVS
ncbi:MAG TPA: hypothetical protein VLA67_02170 [Nitrospiraceae bacterium]|nr:hypothetical protein [Nitrospiraceae bacterium]